ncbi:MAG: MATE family efflux transporter [Paracoccaceae bacterium]
MSAAKFTRGSTMRHVVVMTVTASLGLLSLFAVDALNLFYISLLGVEELAAAIGFAGTIQFFMISVSIGLLIAGTATVSRAEGAGDRARARHLATSALVTAALALTFVSALVWIWRDPALELLGAQGEALALASMFLAITLPSVPLVGIGMCCSGTLRAIGEANRAMYVTLGGGLIAAVLDPILIFGLDLGLTGAGIAMVLTRGAIAAIGLWLVISKHDMLARPDMATWLDDLPPLARLAAPIMATQLSTPFGNAYLTATVAEFGDSAVAGWAVVGRITALAFGGIFALAGAVGPIIGQNYGAGLWPRVTSTYRNGLIFTAIYVCLAWALLAAASDLIIGAFALQAEGAQIVSTFATLTAGAFAFTGALFVSNAAFNNLGRPLWSTMFNWSRDAAVIPLLVLLVAGGMGASGVVWIKALAAVIVGTIAAITGWYTVHALARRGAAPPHGPADVPSPDFPPAPAFASGRAVSMIAPKTVSEPLATEEEKR